MRLLVLVALVSTPACSKAPSAQPPDPDETPPLTKDPDAVWDRPELQRSIPPPPGMPEGTGINLPRDRRPDGGSCLQGDDCKSGVCEGFGCGEETPGKCVPQARACTKDLREYCGCDGKLFLAPGNCPGVRYAPQRACRR
ncbi:MAG: hypothetical protein ACTHU0_35650 [Kofleriaceae bacterium]